MTNSKMKIDPEVQIEEALTGTEMFIQKNGKTLISIIVALFVIVGGFFAYDQLVKIPSETKALNASFVAQQYFAQNDLESALNGTEENMGFLAIAKEYSSTAVGNIANHYAGICYLNLGQYENAIASLKKYNKVDGKASEIINAQNLGLIGDANAQLKNTKEAINYYEKAAAIENSFSSPYYLKKAGLIMLAQKDVAGAKKAFEKIKANYAGSFEGRDIEKYIGQCAE